MSGVKGRSGRRPISIAEHLRRGTYRADRHGPVSPAAPPVEPVDVRPPIGLIGFAAEEWSRLIPILTAEGLLSRLDRTLLASFCLAWGRLCSAQAALDDGGGLTTTDGKGVTRPRVEVKIAAEATSAMAKLAADLGLTRSARGRLGLSVAVNPPDAPPARRAQRHDGIFDPEVDKDFS